MAKKSLNLKQLMIEKGERIALGAAAVLMLVLMGVGIAAGVTRISPTVTTQDIKDKSAKIETNLVSGPAKSNPKVNPELQKAVTREPLPVGLYVTDTPNWIDSPLEDKKRKNPEILGPVEWDTDPAHTLVRVQVESLMIQQQGDTKYIGVLLPREAKTAEKGGNAADLNKYIHTLYMKGKLPKFKPGQDPKAYMEQLKQMQLADDAKEAFRMEMVPAGKIPDKARLARTVQPHRIVILSASFPYRAQLELFRQALKQQRVEDLASPKDLTGTKTGAAGESLMPQFLTPVVQRRAFDQFGKMREDWAEVKIRETYHSAFPFPTGTDDEDPNLADVDYDGLVFRLPRLARGSYPRPRLEKLDQAIKTLNDKRAEGTAILKPIEHQFGEGIDPFQRVKPIDKEGKIPPMKDPRTVKGEDPSKLKPGQPEAVWPDYCLVRVVDPDENLKPGWTYEYQVKIRVANPNYKKKDVVAYPSLADVDVLEGKWAPEKPIRVTLGSEMFFYATELDAPTLKEKQDRDTRLYALVNNREAAFVQVHQWLDKVRLSPDALVKMPIGDWSVADVPVVRGEYIGRMEQVKLPMWWPQRDGFDFAVPPPATNVKPPTIGGKRTPAAKGILVNFTPEDTLVVDWDGGVVRQSFKFDSRPRDVTDTSAYEILVLGPDGKLRVRNSRTDAKNDARMKRMAAYKQLLDDTERGVGRPGGAGGPDKRFDDGGTNPKKN